MKLLAAAPHDDRTAVPGFVDVDEVPDSLLDHDPNANNARLIEEEGDDRVHQETGGVVYAGEKKPPLQSAGPFPSKSRARIVPLRREIKAGSRGKDVLALKRALSHAGYLKWPKKWSLVMGPVAVAALNRFKKQHGLKANSVYGIQAHRKLVVLGHFDRYGAQLMGLAPRPRPTPDRKAVTVQDRIETYLFWAYHHRDQIDYLQRRPMHMANVYELPSREDCSEFATRAFKAGGAPDPNGEFYNGTGWTGTLSQHGARGPWQTAALNFYGAGYPYRHVTVGVGKTRCMSMGSTPGPLLEAVTYRPDYSLTHVYRLTK